MDGYQKFRSSVLGFVFGLLFGVALMLTAGLALFGGQILYLIIPVAIFVLVPIKAYKKKDWFLFLSYLVGIACSFALQYLQFAEFMSKYK